MKSLNIKFPFTVNDLLNYFDQLNTKDLQLLVDKLTKLISNRKNQNPEDQETQLLSIIKQSLPNTFINRFRLINQRIIFRDIGLHPPEFTVSK